MAAKYRNDKHDADRELDLFLIAERAAWVRRTGRYPSRGEIDDRIKKSKEYAKELKRVELKYNVKAQYSHGFGTWGEDWGTRV